AIKLAIKRRTRQKHNSRRVRVATTRALSHAQPLTVPTRWVKFVIGVFLLPLCAVLTQTFFTSFARAAVVQRLWAGEGFWFFSLGVLLWLIAFFGLPRPMVLYVFGHELTHALWVWLMGGRVSRSQISFARCGSDLLTNIANFSQAIVDLSKR